VPRVVEKSIYSTEEVEPGQYVHNPEWDLTPYQLWKRKQAAKKGLQQQPSANSLPEPARKVVTVRKQKPRPQPAAAAPQQSRFQNFQQVEQQRSSPAYQQQQPRREQAYYQPAPQQPVQPAYQQPAFKQQTFQQPQQPQRAAYQQPAYQQPGVQQPGSGGPPSYTAAMAQRNQAQQQPHQCRSAYGREATAWTAHSTWCAAAATRREAKAV